MEMIIVMWRIELDRCCDVDWIDEIMYVYVLLVEKRYQVKVIKVSSIIIFYHYIIIKFQKDQNIFVVDIIFI